MKYDYETIEMIIQDFCSKQQDLIINEISDYIDKTFVDVKDIAQEDSNSYSCSKENFDDFINRILDSNRYNKYIRIPKPLQDYLDVRVIAEKEVSEEIQKAKYEAHMDLINSIHNVNRGLRRHSSVQEQRMNGEYS